MSTDLIRRRYAVQKRIDALINERKELTTKIKAFQKEQSAVRRLVRVREIKARKLAMWEMRRDGHTFKAIGIKVDRSPGRVRELLTGMIRDIRQQQGLPRFTGCPDPTPEVLRTMEPPI